MRWKLMWAYLILKKTKNKSGFTLAETLITLGIISFVLLAVATVAGNLFANVQRWNLINIRNNALVNIRGRVSDVNVIRASLNNPNNPQQQLFRDCVCGFNAKPCASMTAPSTASQVTLYDPSGTTQVSPVYYNSTGGTCNPVDPSCEIMVTTNLEAQCLPNLPSANPVPSAICTGPAELIAITYYVQPNPISPKASSIIKPVSGRVFMQVQDINPPLSGVCP